MARLSDHDQRDAEHVLRAEIALILARYQRRMAEKGKAYITEAISEAVKSGKEIDGETIGRTAAARVKGEYATAKPEPAYEVPANLRDNRMLPGESLPDYVRRTAKPNPPKRIRSNKK